MFLRSHYILTLYIQAIIICITVRVFTHGKLLEPRSTLQKVIQNFSSEESLWSTPPFDELLLENGSWVSVILIYINTKQGLPPED